MGMATAQLATNLGIIAFIASLEFESDDLGAWSAMGLNEIFVTFSIIVVCSGFVSYLLFIYHVFLSPM